MNAITNTMTIITIAITHPHPPRMDSPRVLRPSNAPIITRMITNMIIPVIFINSDLYTLILYNQWKL